MKFLKQVLEYIRTTLGNMSGAQKTALGILALVVVFAIVWGATTATSNGWTKIVDATVDKSEQAQILAKLQEKTIEFQIKDGAIYVQKEIADKTVIELHGEGFFSEAMLWKFLEESNLTKSKWQQEKQFQIALQRKLEHMISSIEGIKRATVALTPGDLRDTLMFKGAPPTAAVTVELKPGKNLTRVNQVAIARLVAHTMTNLQAHNVTLVDTTGRLYKIPKADEMSARDIAIDYEDIYIERIRKEVREIYPMANIGVNVELSTERSRESITEPTGKPVPVADRSESRKETIKSGDKTTGFKAEGKETTDGSPGQEVDISEKANEAAYKTGERRFEKETPAGAIKWKSLTVQIPVAEASLEAERGKINDYRTRIMNVAGTKDPDAVSVEIVPMPKPPETPVVTAWERLMEFLGRFGTPMILFVVALFAVYIIYRLLKAAVPTGVMEQIEALRGRLAAEPGVGAEDLPVAPVEIDRIKLSVREMVQRNPRGVAGILKRWMTGK